MIDLVPSLGGIAAQRVVRYLERAGYVVMKKPPLGVNRLQSLTPPFSDNSKSCCADRGSDPPAE